jgi:hypothetical protein
MGMSLTDLDRWDPESIRAVAAAASSRAEHFREVARGLDTIVARLEWAGASRDAAEARAKTISTTLINHADGCDRAAGDISSAAAEVESVKSEWNRIQRLADRWGITIDITSGSLSRFESSDPRQRAEDQRHLQIVHDAIVGLLRRADSSDQRLASSVAKAMSEMADGGDAESLLGLGPVQRRNQSEAFRAIFGDEPVTDTDWATAAALDPHSYNPKNNGVPPNIVVARIKPVPGQGLVRTNLFIPSKAVWAPAIDWLPYDNHLGDDRGFSPAASPEDSRVTIYTDFENGLVVARQNPSVNADTGEVRTGTPSVAALQQPNGTVLIRYNAADPFPPGGDALAKAIGLSVNGTLGIAPSPSGARIGADDVTTFPALEIYSDRGGSTTPLVQSWPSFTDDASGPLIGLPLDKDLGDPSVIASFNSVVPQPPMAEIPRLTEPAPLLPPMTVLPPGNFTPLGPVTDPPAVRIHTPLQGNEIVAPSR